jgi:hypothetical protein
MEQPQTEDQITEPSITGTLLKFYQSRTAQILLDIVRVMMLIGVIFLIIYIVKNVEMVKLLNSDVCAICANQTGCSCFCGLTG